MLNFNIKLNSRDNDGMTALVYAAKFADHERVEILLKYDAKVDAKGNDGEAVHASSVDVSG